MSVGLFDFVVQLLIYMSAFFIALFATVAVASFLDQMSDPAENGAACSTAGSCAWH